ncbi:hypothetical protein LOTGIDRAFT_142774 [Lottia gigantea]|uniref:GOLD domain-containing protein n=1 Tax=Lottia gigantea TaxID=225164 RepID=V4AY57_LOTGI|nr:hypothetical protein LOTGIDRAFT_142774 [Lottia gigantea]ESO98526.1 hypothetical protein LOTGIDRAFT_142774 [Lottia gigantea]
MAISQPILLALYLVCIVTQHIVVLCVNLDGSQDDFDTEGFPGVQYEFKLQVEAGTEECFYQKISKGSKLHVSFEVLQGGDLNIDFYFKDPHFNLIDSHMYKSSGGIEHDINTAGTYSICLDNSFSHFTSKLVYFYLVTFIPEEWSKYVIEISDVHALAENYTVTVLLTGVQTSISEMRRYQSQSRFSVMKDWYLIKTNNEYIQTWSIIQCLVIIFTSSLTVFFVRRLFKVSTVTPSSKPRA